MTDLSFLKRTAATLAELNDDLGQMRASREREKQLDQECWDLDRFVWLAERDHGKESDEYLAAYHAWSEKRSEHRAALERFLRLHPPLRESDETPEPRRELSEDEITYQTRNRGRL